MPSKSTTKPKGYSKVFAAFAEQYQSEKRPGDLPLSAMRMSPKKFLESYVIQE